MHGTYMITNHSNNLFVLCNLKTLRNSIQVNGTSLASVIASIQLDTVLTGLPRPDTGRQPEKIELL